MHTAGGRHCGLGVHCFLSQIPTLKITLLSFLYLDLLQFEGIFAILEE